MNLVVRDKLELFKKLFPRELIKTIDEKQGAEHYILDINNRGICKISKNFEVCRLALEVRLLRALQGKLKTKIPVVEYYEPHFLVYKKIAGVELTSIFYDQLNDLQKERLAYDIAFFLYELHNHLTLEGAQELGLTRNFWPWTVDQLRSKTYLIEDDELKKIFEIFIDNYGNIRRDDAVKLIHNDIILRNIIVNEQTGQLSGIVDFTDVAVDDPYVDLRLNYTSILQLSESIAQQYAQRAHIPLAIKKIYLYYVATEFSRYLQHREEQKHDELSIIKKRIISYFLLSIR